MPKKFIRTERAIARAINKGKIPKYYYKHGIRYKSNPYALARHATGYYGTTHDIGMKHPLLPAYKHPKSAAQTAELILKGNKRYISHMFSHLKHEHPSTRRRMSMKY